MRIVVVVGALAAVALSAACPDCGGGEGEGEGEPAVTVDDLAAAFDARAAACGDDIYGIAVDRPGAPPLPEVDNPYRAPALALPDTVAFVADKMAPCLPLIEDAPCAGLLPLTASTCAPGRLVEGTLEAFTLCDVPGGFNEPSGCGPGLVCLRDPDDGCGTCTPAGVAGEECGASSPCAEGLICDALECVAALVDRQYLVDTPCGSPRPSIIQSCDSTFAGLACVDERCRPMELVDTDGVCNGVDLECRSFLDTCTDVDGDVTVRCRPLGAEGDDCTCATCAAGRGCGEGLFCDIDDVAGTAICAVLGGAGDPCAARAACADGLHCIEGECAAPRGEDAACRPDDVDNQCEDDLVCEVPGVCTRLAPVCALGP